jgi:hypothetical protein
LIKAQKEETKRMAEENDKKDRPKRESGGSSSEIEKRLDKIEQTLEEIQRELRRKRRD